MQFLLVPQDTGDIRRGPKSDDVLAALDEEAAQSVATGIFPNATRAATHYLSRYTERTFSEHQWDQRNDAIKRAAKRINKKLKNTGYLPNSSKE